MEAEHAAAALELALRRPVRFSIWIWWVLPLPLLLLCVMALLFFGSALVGALLIAIRELFLEPPDLDLRWVKLAVGWIHVMLPMLSGVLGALVGLLAIPASLRVATCAMRWDRHVQLQGSEFASSTFIRRVIVLGAMLSSSLLMLVLGGVGVRSLW